MPGTQLYPPGIHRADLKNNPFQPCPKESQSLIKGLFFILFLLFQFRNMAFYINDSIFGSIFFFLTGLHFFHVIVGIILIGIILCIVSLPQRILPFHLYYNLQLIYWHFIELLWLFIYIILYSY